jgi:hypothetical protein
MDWCETMAEIERCRGDEEALIRLAASTGEMDEEGVRELIGGRLNDRAARYSTARLLHLPLCDLCVRAGLLRQAIYDARTRFGPAAFLCEEDFREFGVGLGLGMGQRLVLVER